MPQPNDLSRSLVALDQNSTIIAVVELSHSSWLIGGVVPGIERQPRKKLAVQGSCSRDGGVNQAPLVTRPLPPRTMRDWR
jgi:transposase